jgi:hypothetical protein
MTNTADMTGKPPDVCHYVYLDLLNYATDFDAVLLINK